MSEQLSTTRHTEQTLDACVTIVAATMADVMREFSTRGMAASGYAITGRVLKQRFTLAGAEGASDMFEGRTMLAATFMRSQ